MQGVEGMRANIHSKDSAENRRDNIERRECEYTYCIPERRSGEDRRKESG